MRVLILEGAASRGCLAASRSLARAGWHVGVGHPPGHSLAAQSRAVRQVFRLPYLEEGLGHYVDAVAAVIDEHRYDIVFGAGDAELLALAVSADRLPAAVPHRPLEVQLALMDKLRLHQAAQRAGLGSPPTWLASDQGADVATLLGAGPVVVKPRLHWDPDRPTASLRVEAQVARDESELARAVGEVRAAGAQAVLQGYVRGRLLAYIVLLSRESRVLAQAQQHAVHTWPEPAGVSARAVTQAVDEDLADASVSLLREVGATGLFELQFLVSDDGGAYLIDVNARFYGSLQLAVSAGADFPRLWADSALGIEADEAASATPGIQYQWLEGDLRRSAAHRDVVGLVACLQHARQSSHSIWSAADPGPGVAHAWELGRRLRVRRRPGQ